MWYVVYYKVMGAKGGKEWSEGHWEEEMNCNFIFILRQNFLTQPRLTWNFRFSGNCFLMLCLQADRIQ